MSDPYSVFWHTVDRIDHLADEVDNYTAGVLETLQRWRRAGRPPTGRHVWFIAMHAERLLPDGVATATALRALLPPGAPHVPRPT